MKFISDPPAQSSRREFTQSIVTTLIAAPLAATLTGCNRDPKTASAPAAGQSPSPAQSTKSVPILPRRKPAIAIKASRIDVIPATKQATGMPELTLETDTALRPTATDYEYARPGTHCGIGRVSFRVHSGKEPKPIKRDVEGSCEITLYSDWAGTQVIATIMDYSESSGCPDNCGSCFITKVNLRAELDQPDCDDESEQDCEYPAVAKPEVLCVGVRWRSGGVETKREFNKDGVGRFKRVKMVELE